MKLRRVRAYWVSEEWWPVLIVIAYGWMIIALLSGCGAAQEDEATCGTEPDAEKVALTFGRYGGLRSSGELWVALERSAKRWEAAACLGVDVAISPETWVRWRVAADMPGGSSGFASGPYDDARIHLSDALAEDAVAPVLAHEMGHILRRNYGHPCEDGSMSYPAVHARTEPVSHITECDLERVCAVQDCGCVVPESP